MTSATHFGSYSERTAPVADGVAARLKRLIRFLADGLEQRRQREVEEIIGHILAQSGGRFTDSVEAEITRKVLGSGWSLPL
jgi:hypothetical protein